jgi:hypothetical protein
MADPKRLLSEEAMDEISSMERDLLRSLEPTAGERRQVLGSVLAQASVAASAATATSALVSQAGASQGALQAGGSAALGSSPVASGSAATGSAATGLLGALTTKSGILALVAVPVVAAGTYFGVQGSPEVTTSLPTEIQQQTEPPQQRAPVSPLSETIADQEQQDSQGQEQVAPDPPVRSAKTSSLVEEDRMLRKARAAFKEGDHAAALSTLRQLEARYPQGTLAQEREVLRIAILKKTGAEKQAEQRAKDFRSKYPDSPYEAPNADAPEQNPSK